MLKSLVNNAIHYREPVSSLDARHCVLDVTHLMNEINKNNK